MNHPLNHPNDIPVGDSPNLAQNATPADSLDAEQPAPRAPEKSRPRRRRRIFFGLALLVLLVGGTALVIGHLLPRPARIKADHAFLLLSYTETEEAIVYYDGEPVGDPLPLVVDGTSVYYKQYNTSANGKTTLIRGSNGVLYVATKRGMVRLAEDVGDFWDADSSARFSLSADGRYVAFSKDNSLYRYRVGQSLERGLDIVSNEYGGVAFCLSPDGRHVAYEDTHGSLLVYDGRNTHDMGENRIPLAISNDARYIYFMKARGGFYVLSRHGRRNNTTETEVKLGNDAKPLFLFNADYTEVLYLSDNRVALSVKGARPEKLASGNALSVSFLEYADYDALYSAYNADFNCGRLPLDTFIGQYFLSEDGDLKYITRGAAVKTMGTDVSSFTLSENGKVCYYIDKYNDLYRIPKAEGDSTKIDGNVRSVEVTSNGKSCYYLASTTLMYVERDEEPRRVAEDVRQVWLTHDDHLFYLANCTTNNDFLYGSILGIGSVSKGDLYCAYRGEVAARVDEEVSHGMLTATGFAYLSNAESSNDHGLSLTYSVYYTADGTNFRKLGDAVSPPYLFR